VAGYTLIGNYSTVQSISPTIANPIEYCTIQTHPSSVIASIPVQETTFQTNQANVQLGNFANAIEQVMDLPHVIAGVGEQTIDPNGLLADTVSFTVEYVGTSTVPTSVTAEASVPVGLLDFTDGEIGRTLLAEVEAIIDGVYGNLQSAAGG
jgi:hypothetical protein